MKIVIFTMAILLLTGVASVFASTDVEQTKSVVLDTRISITTSCGKETYLDSSSFDNVQQLVNAAQILDYLMCRNEIEETATVEGN